MPRVLAWLKDCQQPVELLLDTSLECEVLLKKMKAIYDACGHDATGRPKVGISHIGQHSVAQVFQAFQPVIFFGEVRR